MAIIKIIAPVGGFVAHDMFFSYVKKCVASPADYMHRLLRKQLIKTKQDGQQGVLNLRQLLVMVNDQYEAVDRERRGTVRSMQLMSQEATDLARRISEQSRDRLQAILDTVKDAIITVDRNGAIDTINPTGERIFGYPPDELVGLPLDLLLPLEGDTNVSDYLEELAQQQDDTQVDLAPHEAVGRQRDGNRFDADISVSKARIAAEPFYVVCLRDTTERRESQQALKESEARYRTLVENAPEAIVVLDVDEGKFVDVNDNAVAFFKFERENFLKIGPEDLSPEYQADGTASFGVERDYIGRALEGDSPVFEWLHCDSAGTVFPCEVRLVRLPSKGRNLIRASVTDITDRKRMEVLAACEKNVFERIASNETLEGTLDAVAATIDKVIPGAAGTVLLLAEDGETLKLGAAGGLPKKYLEAIRTLNLRARVGSCAAAVRSGESVIVDNIDTSPHWDDLRDEANESNLKSCWSTPIKSADDEPLGALAVYHTETKAPSRRDFEVMSRLTQLSRIAVERRRAETAVFEEKERAQVTLESIGDAVIRTDADGNVDYLNPVAEDLTGWEQRAARGRPVSQVINVLDGVTRQLERNPINRCLEEGRVVALSENTVLVNRRGAEIPIQETAAPIHDRGGNIIGAVMIFHDVSKEQRFRRVLSYQASHDPVTGLINRKAFENRLADTLIAVKADETRRHVLLYVDLDQFKLVNDTCGHSAGDQLLKQITALINDKIRTSDVLARLGGDEFGILLEGCSISQAIKIADDLRQSIQDFRFVWQDGALNVGASIGVVDITNDSESAASVLAAADVACYAAKDTGRNRIHVYQQGDAPARHEEMRWISKLTRARDENRFELYYQPIVPIGGNTDEHGHYELLLRMRDETGGLVQPDTFIPAAERYNVMPTVDRWVVHTALSRIANSLVAVAEPAQYTLAINLSGTSLSDDKFLEFVVRELDRYQLPPNLVCFEITETAAISNIASVARFMRELKAYGCLFSLDDFGTGLSSFTYLKNLPVDFLKIDGEFIQNVCEDSIDMSMVDAINKIGQAMGIKVIAERVETPEVLAKLADMGIEYAQGFHIAEPRPVAEFPHADLGKC